MRPNSATARTDSTSSEVVPSMIRCSGRPELITPVHDPSVEADSYDRGASISLMSSSVIPTRRGYPARKSATSSGGISLMPEDLEERASVRTWMAFADDYSFLSVYRVRMGGGEGTQMMSSRGKREALRCPLAPGAPTRGQTRELVSQGHGHQPC